MQGWWDRFWFRSIDARQYAALRIVFGGLSAVYLLGLLPYVETQFSSRGWLGNIQQIAMQNGGSWSLFFIQTETHATTLAYAIVIMGIMAAFLLMIGWKSRLSACISWLVWVSLWNRNPLFLDGDDAVLSNVFLFYAVILRKLLVGRCLFAKKTATSCRLAVTVDAISNRPDLFCVWLGKIPKSGMAEWNDYAIRFDPSSLFAMGWLGFD